jgi:hypothetical protein
MFTIVCRMPQLSQIDRRIGLCSAIGIFTLGLAYVVTLGLGFASVGTFSAPLVDPFLAVLEVEILLMAPLLVLLFASVHARAGESKVATLAALGFIILAAGTTSIVHFVLLTVGHQSPNQTASLGTPWNWPSIAYAVDIVACVSPAILETPG